MTALFHYVRLFAILLIAAPVVVFFIALIAFAVPRGIYDNYRWRSSLKHAGRYRGDEVHFDSIRTGTLILDSPALGWNVTHCWWTPLDLAALSPEPIPTDKDRASYLRANPHEIEMPFDHWVYENFLDVTSGTAILICTRHGDLLAAQIMRTANIPVVKSWSGPITLRATKLVVSG